MEDMPTFFWTAVSFLIRALLSLRYRIEFKGLEKLAPEKLSRPGGILFLPNHPAHMDPLINFVWLWPKFRMRPLVIEYIFKLPLLTPLNKLVRSISIPNFEMAANEWKIKKGEKALQEIALGLKKRENFLLYPAGRLKNTPKELLGGASGAHELLKECPEANVVLIRTSGLWGSSFSRALLGRSPDLAKTLLQGAKVLLKNLIFFAPRRKVVIEIESNPEELFGKVASRVDLNRYLEGWYNRYPDREGNIHEAEPLTLVSYSRWKEELPQVAHLKKRKNGGNGNGVSEEIRRKIYTEIRRILDQPELEIKPEMSLAFDLGMDSLNVAEFITYLTKYFNVAELYPEDLETVGAILQIAAGDKERVSHRSTSPFTWLEEKRRPLPLFPIGRTIPEVFLRSCSRMGSHAACGDDLVGVLSYQRLRKGALVLAQHFKTWKEERVAIMLPASAAAYLTILALQLAGKTPVMLNWTLGPRYLEEMMRISGAQRIISSWRFLDRLPNVEFGACVDRFVLLEEIRKGLSLKKKLCGLFLSHLPPRGILRAMGLQKADENSPCVILFTSGTEAAPKGVPLSHKNILTNESSAMECVDLEPEDVVYGILPPFHSFGFSVAGLFPILCGIRVAFYPDPTDSFALAEGVDRWKVTLFCAAPSFLKGLFYAAKANQLHTIRYFVSGAEKAPRELFQRVEQLGTHAKLLEGYGITECSPILTLNRPNLPPKGGGTLIPGIEAITIHPETLVLLPKGTEGEICVRGPNVFNGYLGNPRSPFIEIEGKKWYRTGDLGWFTSEGNLMLSGRLKRFTKLGGEMISLGAIEEILVKHLLEEKRISPDIPSLAVCADEREDGKPQLIVFVTVLLTKEEANRILQKEGFSNLVKISSVRKIEEIPLMGAGKTDYRSLQSLC